MHFNEYQKLSAKTDSIICPKTEIEMERMLMNAALGACGEAGKFSGTVKGIYYEGHEFTAETLKKMMRELGDQLWYIAKAARALGCSLESIAMEGEEYMKGRTCNTGRETPLGRGANF